MGDGTTYAEGCVLVDDRGRIAALGSAVECAPPAGVRVLRAAWVGPALHDAHVHLAFGSSAEMLAGGVATVRAFGAPLADALRWREPGRVSVAGPILTAPHGYPSRGWGRAGFARFVGSPDEARIAVRDLVESGVDLVKIALEPAGGQPVLSGETAAAVVRAAHDAGRAVAAHALTTAMVERALDAGVDELAHTPVEGLPPPLVERIATGTVRVVSTIEPLTSYKRSQVTANAAALVRAGVQLRYGTDLGNAGTRSGAEPRELERLAAAGLGGTERCGRPPNRSGSARRRRSSPSPPIRSATLPRGGGRSRSSSVPASLSRPSSRSRCVSGGRVRTMVP